jgi:chromosome segregation ATPase
MIAFLRSRTAPFRARSPERDKETDAMNIARVARAIDQAIASCATERDGLGRRLADVTSRAAIVAGTGSDDYPERERAVSDRLSVLDSEVKNAQRRLDELAYNIAQFEHLREELKSRFSALAGSGAAGRGTKSHGARHPAAAS